MGETTPKLAGFSWRLEYLQVTNSDSDLKKLIEVPLKTHKRSVQNLRIYGEIHRPEMAATTKKTERG